MFRIDKGAFFGSGNHWVDFTSQKNIGKSQLVQVWFRGLLPNNDHFQVWIISEYDIIHTFTFMILCWSLQYRPPHPKYHDFGYVAPIPLPAHFWVSRTRGSGRPARLIDRHVVLAKIQNILCDCKFQKHRTPEKPTTIIFRGYNML